MTRGRRWKRARHVEQQGGVARTVGYVCVRQTDRQRHRETTDRHSEGGRARGSEIQRAWR